MLPLLANTTKQFTPALRGGGLTQTNNTTMIFTYCLVLLITTFLGSVALSLATQSHDGKANLWVTLIDAWVTTITVVAGLGFLWVILAGLFALLK